MMIGKRRKRNGEERDKTMRLMRFDGERMGARRHTNLAGVLPSKRVQSSHDSEARRRF